METAVKDKTRVLLYGVVALLCALLAVQVLAQGSATGRAKPSIAQWQHLALTHVIGETPQNELARSINKLGQEGWELVSVANVSESGTTTKTVFYFKKPL
jgi:hypothetical protein